MSHVTLTTEAKNFHQYPPIVTFNASTATVVRMSSTKPASTTGVNLVFGASLNYLKFKFYTDVSQTTNIAIYGWNYVLETGAYVPQLLVLLAGTNTAASATIPGIGAGQFEITSWTPNQGDSKNYNGTTTTTPGGFILVDTLGCEYIEVRPYAAATATLTVLAAGL
jgi:hypothetical protein